MKLGYLQYRINLLIGSSSAKGRVFARRILRRELINIKSYKFIKVF